MTRTEVTIRDVASLANVSVSTVSNALSGRRAVSEQTRQRVKAAAEHLQYSPDMAAHSLRTGVRHAIGLVIPDITNPFFAEVSRGVEDAAQDQGWAVFVGNTDLDEAKQSQYLMRLARASDGVIVCPTTSEPGALTPLVAGGTPMVICDERVVVPGAGGVFSDNVGGGRLVGEHLAARGARRCAMVAGPSDLPTTHERRRGLEAGLRSAGLTLPASRVAHGPYTVDAGAAICRQLLAADPRIDAIFAADDLMAIGAITALQEAGRSVPEDVLVCGFDGIFWGPLLRPSITTIKQQTRQLGVEAARLLLSMALYEEEAREVVLSVSLTEGDSTRR